MRNLVVLVFAAAWASGCAKSLPTAAGGKPVVHWVESTHSPDPKVRKEAVFKLGNVGPADASAFPAIVEALRDKDPKVRSEAIFAVLKFGPRAAEAAAELAELRDRDPNAEVRGHALRALEKLSS